jgi:hypothetical protein
MNNLVCRPKAEPARQRFYDRDRVTPQVPLRPPIEPPDRRSWCHLNTAQIRALSRLVVYLCPLNSWLTFLNYLAADAEKLLCG